MAGASNKISSPSSTLPFKSNKNVSSNSTSLLKDPQSLSSKTPEKPAERTRKRKKVALSIEEVERAAQSVHESNSQLLPHDLTTEGSKVVRRRMDSRSNESQSSSSDSTCVDNKYSNKLPEKFELLCKFFDCLNFAMRLLRCKGVASNFSHVCSKIEVLTDR
ncbi:hypothetical protein Csa_001826, partial [Cucumis sativus]